MAKQAPPTIKTAIAKLLKSAPEADPVGFENSGWLDDPSPAVIKKAIKAQEPNYEKRLQEVVEVLGEPAQTDKKDRKAIAQWYPEAIRAACWLKDGKTICLALEQQDQESPVGIVLRCLTADEIAELSE